MLDIQVDCSACGTHTGDFMRMKDALVDVALCEVCWGHFIQKAPVDVLEIVMNILNSDKD